MFLTKFLKLYKTVQNVNTNSYYNKQAVYLQKRQLSFILEWIIKIFNGVDTERVKLVGPDCVCAEWLLRNGASVRFKGHGTLLSDYHELIALEEINAKILKVEEIYGKEASLHYIGFNHLSGCNHIKKITLIFCTRVNDAALYKLHYVKNTLEHLELTSCFNVQDEGLNSLCNLSNLKTLILADLVSVKDKDACESALRKALPNCKIDFKK